jgi:hypothetical protein
MLDRYKREATGLAGNLREYEKHGVRPIRSKNLTEVLTLRFYKHVLAWGRKSTGSECVLLKAQAFQIVQNYGLSPTLRNSGLQLVFVLR